MTSSHFSTKNKKLQNLKHDVQIFQQKSFAHWTELCQSDLEAVQQQYCTMLECCTSRDCTKLLFSFRGGICENNALLEYVIEFLEYVLMHHQMY